MRGDLNGDETLAAGQARAPRRPQLVAIRLPSDRRRCDDAPVAMTDPAQPSAEPVADLVEPEEMVDGVPVLAAEVRALERAVPRRNLPAVQAAAVAATGFAVGAATVVAIQRKASARRPARLRRRKRDAGPEVMSVLGTRSFLLDVHLLGRGE
jgi:hypothetical protein